MRRHHEAIKLVTSCVMEKSVRNIEELSAFSLANLPFSVSRDPDLVAEQQAEASLKCLFDQVLPMELEKDSSCEDFVGDPIYRQMIPTKYRAQ